LSRLTLGQRDSEKGLGLKRWRVLQNAEERRVGFGSKRFGKRMSGGKVNEKASHPIKGRPRL